MFATLGLISAQELQLQRLGGYASGIINAGGSEVVAYDSASQRLYVVNAGGPSVDILDIRNPFQPRALPSIGIPVGFSPNSVAVKNGLVAVAIQAPRPQDNGIVGFYDIDGNILSAVPVGALPDMITFTPDGKRVLTANEGEPATDYSIDPEGTVSIVDIAGKDPRLLSVNDVRTVRFTQFNGQTLDPSIRVFGPGATAAQDFEPEYIAVSPDSSTAYVTLQENNAIAVVDIEAARVTRLIGLGFKDHSLPQNSLDPSDRDNAVNLVNGPVLGMYLPDGIATYASDRGVFLLTANEGDARDYQAIAEERRVGELRLDATAFPNAAALQANASFGRLRVTSTLGDTDGDGDYDKLYSFGGRSFSVWDAARGRQVFDSGNQFELIQAANRAELFNVSNANNTVDDRSDDKGPEPEGIVVGRVGSRDIAFILNERDGSILMYDLTEPTNPQYAGRTDTRVHTGNLNNGTAGDLGPETAVFISAAESPTGRPLLAVAYEISGTVSIFEVR